jgi:DNA-binding LacI/PurR family transcriptional regulator
MSTVRDIATSAGVSPATVSRSLNNPEVVSRPVRERVLREAERLGYRQLPQKKAEMRSIGLLYFDETPGGQYVGYDAVIWAGVIRAAQTLKTNVVTLDPLSRNDGEPFDHFVERMGVDGLVIRVDEQCRHLCAEVARAGVPHIVVADRFEDATINYIQCDSREASTAAVRHLIELGHTAIGMCHNVVTDTDHQDRIDGYEAALKEAGIEIDPRLRVPASPSLDGGAAVLTQFLAMAKPPTAIFAADPMLAVGITRRAHELGLLVPDEMSVVGVDDGEMRRISLPCYTAIRQDASEIGFRAGQWLCREIRDDVAAGGKLQLRLEAFLEINQSTASPPKNPVRMTPNGQRVEV